MRVSVISPSYNQAQFLPDNIASVASQTHGDVEHVIVDPGSTDGSTEIAAAAPNVTLIAEPDRGQSDGICKGFARSTGDILVWLNSDDFYPTPDVLEVVAETFRSDSTIDVVYGDVNFVDERGEFLRKGYVNSKSETLASSLEYQVGIVQPGVFWRRNVFEALGGPSEEYEYCMDYELWVRMATSGLKWSYLPKVLAHHRWWDGMKTSSRRDLSLLEHFRVCDRYFGYIHWKWIERYAEYLCTEQDGVVNHATTIDQDQRRMMIAEVVDKYVTQNAFRDLSISDSIEKKETRDFILEYVPDFDRIYFEAKDLAIVEESCDDPKASQRIAWNTFDVVDEDQHAYVAYHVPDNFDRYFRRDWYEEKMQLAEREIARLAESRSGEECVIVGNGPSLRKSDLSLLENVDTIICNFAPLSDQLAQHGNILTVVNDLVAKQGFTDFNQLEMTKFVPFWLGNYFNDDGNTFFVRATVKPEFSQSFVNDASWRSTVSYFNMQLAFAIGYTKVILIGFDNSYVQPKEVTEGVVISQKDGDDNHFDSRYFKGKDWQAADTENMEKMYLVAKKAFEADGREIVNCTVGGKLEVFRRGDLEKELNYSTDDHSNSISEEYFPRVLVIDPTPIGHQSATGQIKSALFAGWPASKLLQVWEDLGPEGMLKIWRKDSSSPDTDVVESRQFLLDTCKEFCPEVIYFRPVDSLNLHKFVEEITAANDAALILHVMDDWQIRLSKSDAAKFKDVDSVLRRLIARSTSLLSISERMSVEYGHRYGREWTPIANGVDPAVYASERRRALKQREQDAPFLIRYMGGLADDMTFHSVRELAKVVSDLSQEESCKFEVFTMDWYLERAKLELESYAGVSVHPLVPYDSYVQAICEADAGVIAYNFDSTSFDYAGLSMANKMPEWLMSGVPLIAYGPADFATIADLLKRGCAEVITTRSHEETRERIRRLIRDSQYRESLASRARVLARSELNRSRVARRFRSIFREAAWGNLVDPNDEQEAHKFDSTNLAAEIQHSRRFVRIVGDHWEYDSVRDGDDFWLSVHRLSESSKDRNMLGTISVVSDKDVEIILSLGRHSGGEYEGASKHYSLQAGVPQKLFVRKKFLGDHRALKLQIQFLNGQSLGDATLNLSRPFVCEGARSIAGRVGRDVDDLEFVNEVFLSGNYVDAFPMYVHLCSIGGLDFCRDSAFLCVQKLGVCDNAEEFVELVETVS